MLRARALLNYPMPGSPGITTIYTRVLGPENQAAADISSGRLQTAWDTMAGFFPTTMTVVADTVVEAIDETTGSVTGSWNVDPWTITGTDGITYLPPANQACVTWLTDEYIAGRRLRGRTFVGPLSANTTNGFADLYTSVQTALASFVSAWVDPATTDVYSVVWHRPKGASPGAHYDISAGRVKPTVSVLRSRRD